MEKKNIVHLNIGSEAFESMRTDFDKILKRTLTNMEAKESDAAEITVKVKIALNKELVSDPDVFPSNSRMVTKPTLSHKVSSVMQIKDEESGSIKGNYELVWDDTIGDYVMRQVDDGQVTFEDGEFVDCETMDNETMDDEDVFARKSLASSREFVLQKHVDTDFSGGYQYEEVEE